MLPQLDGLPVRVTYPAHPLDPNKWYGIYAINKPPLYNRWDYIEVKSINGHLEATYVSVAFYVNYSSYDDSAIICHLFLKCLDLLGVNGPPIEKWAYVSPKRSNVFVIDEEMENIERHYIRFLKVCKNSYESRKSSRALRCGKHWYEVMMARRRRIQKRVWDHWLELALRPGASLYKLYEARFKADKQ